MALTNTVENDGFANIDDLDETEVRILSVSEGIPEKLANGRWACKHTCKDKTSYVKPRVLQMCKSEKDVSCKHLCCRDGLERMPKPSKSSAPAPKLAQTRNSNIKNPSKHPTQTSTMAKSQVKKLKVDDSEVHPSKRFQPPKRLQGDHNKHEPADLNDSVMQDFFDDIELEIHGPGASAHTPDANVNHVNDPTHYSDGWLDDLPSLTDLAMDEPTSIRMTDKMGTQTYGTCNNINIQDEWITDPTRDGHLAEPSPVRGDDVRGSPEPKKRKTLTTTDANLARKNKEKLFMSTDPPDDSTKENQADSDAADSSSDKIGKLPEDLQIGPENSSVRENVNPPGINGEPVLKAGLPAWAYDFGDLAFIAEWQNLVDLV